MWRRGVCLAIGKVKLIDETQSHLLLRYDICKLVTKRSQSLTVKLTPFHNHELFEGQGVVVNGLIGAQAAVVVVVVLENSAAYTRLEALIVHGINRVDDTIDTRNSGS